ncbi:ATP-binding protein [Thermococcus sp. ES12]|uniref:ATP-binding protein n=1 Tax=Thermococcus sp. ES12 TaxID=1638246 RepID=UPI0014309E6B|nr:ATP-binding protein [Thermococcus sp. ES12]NJE77104.1 ATP-binding protein [Thermococcus sp. ES12]
MVHPDDYITGHILNLPALLKPYNKPKKRELYDWLVSKVDSYLKYGKADTILLLGIRGVGKTTLLAQLYFDAISKTNPNHVLYLPLDRLQAFGLNLLDVVEAYKRMIKPEKAVILLDEVQYEDNWDLKLKLLHDEKRFLIVVTGSSAIKLRESPDLARRALHKELFPMTFREYYRLKIGESLPGLMWEILNLEEIEIPLLREEIVEYVKVGSMPLSLEMEEWEVYERLITMLDRVVYRDLREAHEFDAETLDKAFSLLYLMANPKGERFSYEKLSKTLGLAKGTVIKLVDALEKAGLVQKIPTHGSLSKNIRKNPKIKFLAVPIKSALLYKAGININKEEVFASLLEDVVAFYLYLIAKVKMGKLSYEPSKGSADFVLEVGGGKVVVEVGLGKEKKGQVERTMERVGAEKGIVIGRRYKVDERVAFYPWQVFVAGF